MVQCSEVYFTSMKITNNDEPLPMKFRRLLVTAGLSKFKLDKKFIAIKTHFGETGNMAYLRPNYAKVVVDLVKEAGGRPFLCDCNTLYPGKRKNALEHLEIAYEHGFSPFSTGCHILIGDGLDGTDEVLVPVEGGVYVKEAKIGRAIMDADMFISLNHFKGHMETGFGGALKNIGMGCGSRAGKMEMHSASSPGVKGDRCISCKKCSRFCGSDAITYEDGTAFINPDICVGCGHCIAACPVDAIFPKFDENNQILDAKIAEYAKAVLSGRRSFHISFVIDVSPLCDCFGANDIPIVPNIGIFVSRDPVALDMACADAVNAQMPTKGSILAERVAEQSTDHDHAAEKGSDHFMTLYPSHDWRAMIDHAVSLGIGNADYELIEV